METSRMQSRFQLIHYFVVASIAAALAAASIPVLVSRYSVLDEQSNVGAETAQKLRALTNAIELQLADDIGALSIDSGLDRHQRRQAATIDQGIANLTVGLPTVNVRVHRPDGVVVYAFNREGIGKQSHPNRAVADAVASGKPSVRLIPRGKAATERGLQADHDWMESFIPIRTDTGEIIRVFELAADVTARVDAINAASLALILALLGVVGLAYVAMSLLVVRASRVLSRQNLALHDVGRDMEIQNKRLQQEVVERTQAEERLSVAESRKAFILESALEAVITVDDQGLTVEYNNAALNIFGYSKEEIIGQDVAELIIPEEKREQHSAAFAKYLNSGVGMSNGNQFQVNGRRKSGEEFPLQIAITSFLLGGCRYFTAVMQDITERLQSEKIRDEGERVLLDVIEASPVAICITDNSGRLLYWNTQFFQMGRNSRDENGNRIFGLVFGQPSVHADLLARVHAGGRVLNEEAELSLGDATVAWVLVSMQNMVFEGKAAVLTWLYDISGLKRQEQALMVARNDAERASRSKTDFLATMSHEIRTPMNGVVAMSEILDQTELLVGQRAMTTIIRDSAVALLAIIDDVLDFSKIEAGKLDISPVSLSLPQIIEGVADLLGTRSAEKGLELIVTLDPDIPDHLFADPVRIRQVLLNLIGNAIKFTDKGYILVEITMMGQKDDVAELLFRTIDTGPGITPDLHNQLFNPFVQADSSTARRFGGTGLGLSICKTLVGLMGGSIGVDSVVGEGSTFWFRLSLPILHERRLPDYADLVGLRILMVISLPALARSLRDIMTYARANVVEVTTAQAAINALRSYIEKGAPIDVVLLDHEISSASGLTLAREIASTRGLDSVPVILMAPKMLAFSFMSAQHDGPFTILSKPVHRRALCQVVAAAAGRRVALNDDPTPQRRGDEAVRPTYIPPSPEEAIAGGALILVAEDNLTNQTVIRMLLERLGFVADMAEDGAVAWWMLHEKKYGLLLTDCHMPEVDGFQLSRIVRDEERDTVSRLPIIALTADAISGAAEKCSDAGMDGYLKKPVSWSELEAVIQKWCPAAIAMRRKTGTPHNIDSVDYVVLQQPQPEPLPVEGVPTFDPTYLLDILDGDESMLGPMLAEFVDTTRPLIEELLAALEREDCEQARRKAHSCAGASKTAGAMEFAALCSTIEMAIVANDHVTARQAGTDILSTFQRATDTMLDFTAIRS